MRLSRHIGPTIINLSQVTGDVLIMLVIWIWLVMSWTFGSMYLDNNRIWIKERNTTQNQANFVSEFAKTFHYRMGNLLVYEKRDIDFANSSARMDWIEFSDGLMFFCYQSFIVVVGLNLLIAIMNSTIQRCV